MDKEKAKKLKENAQRTIKIIEMLERGNHPSEIAFMVNADRQLVEYYKKVLSI